MKITLIISALTFLGLAVSILLFPTFRIKGKRIATYWPVASIGAALLIVFRCVPPGEIASSFINNSAVNPFKILVLFFSMTFLSVFLDEAGMFRYLAKKAVAVAGNSQFVLFTALYFTVALLTVFTSNDIIILTLTPFICFFCKNTQIDPLPFLVSEFAAANTWSMMLIIGNPTNIYLGTSAGIGFFDYLKIMLLPTLAAGFVEFVVLILLFRKKLKKTMSPQPDNYIIGSKLNLWLGVIHLAICLVLLIIGDYIGAEMWSVSAVCAASLVLSSAFVNLLNRKGNRYLKNAVKRLPWQLIPFVTSMFIVVICFNYQGIAQRAGEFLGSANCVWKYGIASFIMSNIINNIPMSILFSELPRSLSGAGYCQAIYASVVGSNIGAFLTPIGALAGIMFTSLTERQNVGYTFKKFIFYGALIAIPTILAALGSLSFLL